RDDVLECDRDPGAVGLVEGAQERVQLPVALGDHGEVGGVQFGSTDLFALDQRDRVLGGQTQRVDHAARLPPQSSRPASAAPVEMHASVPLPVSDMSTAGSDHTPAGGTHAPLQSPYAGNSDARVPTPCRFSSTLMAAGTRSSEGPGTTRPQRPE